MARGAAVLTLLALVCSACVPGSSGEGVRTELVAATGRIGGLDPLAAASLDPSGPEALAGSHVFEGLTRLHPETLEVQPGLAASWDVTPDAAAYSFHLRPGVAFHDGSPVRAADVAATLNRLAAAACVPASSPLAGAPTRLLEAVVGFEAVAVDCEADALEGVRTDGESVVEIRLREPSAELPVVLAHPALVVLPADGVDDAAPVGTGPYRVEEPWDGSRLVLERNEEHWREVPRIARVRLVGYDDESLAYADFVEGEVDYAPVPVNRARGARRAYGERGFPPRVGVTYFGFNLGSPKVAPLAFRRGLSLAVDRRSLSTGIYEGVRTPAGGVASPVLPGVDEGACGEACGYDPEAARRAIAEAYPDGPPELVIGVSEDGGGPALGEALVGMLEEVGVPARLERRPLANHVRAVDEGVVDLFSFGWVPPYATQGAVLRPLFRSGSRDNRTGYASPEVDALLDEARTTLAPPERRERYREAERRILADLPVIPVLWHRSSLVLDEAVRVRDGALVDGFGTTHFEALSFVPEDER